MALLGLEGTVCLFVCLCVEGGGGGLGACVCVWACELYVTWEGCLVCNRIDMNFITECSRLE